MVMKQEQEHRFSDTRVDDKLSKLFIEDVVEGDSGEYSCEARNRPGIVARSTVKITVKGKNEFYSSFP